MGLIEHVFSELIERKYHEHDIIQKKENGKLRSKSMELHQVDELAEAFEQKMELAANEMERWLIKHE